MCYEYLAEIKFQSFLLSCKSCGVILCKNQKNSSTNSLFYIQYFFGLLICFFDYLNYGSNADCTPDCFKNYGGHVEVACEGNN